MDKDRIADSAKQAKGSVKDAIGKVTGEPKGRPRKRLARCRTRPALPEMRRGMP